MTRTILLIICWASMVFALISMMIGHTGEHQLNWMTNQISTFAASAPFQGWITAAMVLPCISLASIAILITRYHALGDSLYLHFVSLLAGSSASGLLTLASYKETAQSLNMLKSSGLDAIRQQSFHDAGLLVFFYSTVFLAFCLGLAIMFHQKNWKEKITGFIIAVSGMASVAFMRTPWPGLIGISGSNPGLKQRASLFCLWISFTLITCVISGNLKILDSTNNQKKGRD